MYKILKSSESVGGTTFNQGQVIEKALKHLEGQLNDGKISKVHASSIYENEYGVHAVAIVEVEDVVKKK